MKPKQHSLKILADNLGHFHSSITSETASSQFDEIVAQLELRIDLIISYIKKDGVHASRKELAFAFSLLRKYIALWKRCFKNRPRPQSAWEQKERRRKATSAGKKNTTGAGSDLKFHSPY